MRPPAHIISSTIAALVVETSTHSTEAALATLISGIFIDIDHLFDYFLRYSKRKLGFRDFFLTHQWGPQGKLYLVFHCWEYLPILIILTFISKYHFLFLGIFWGVLIHLLLDHLNNKGHTLTYFLFFRWKSNFKYTCFFKPSEIISSTPLTSRNSKHNSWKKFSF